MRKKKKIEVPRRTKRLDSRATPDEYNTVKENAKKCGLTISDYMRKCALGHKPKLHLTEREIEAYCSLADARGDLVHIRSALKGKSQEQIKHYFKNERFMQKEQLLHTAVTRCVTRQKKIRQRLSKSIICRRIFRHPPCGQGWSHFK